MKRHFGLRTLMVAAAACFIFLTSNATSILLASCDFTKKVNANTTGSYEVPWNYSGWVIYGGSNCGSNSETLDYCGFGITTQSVNCYIVSPELNQPIDHIVITLKENNPDTYIYSVASLAADIVNYQSYGENVAKTQFSYYLQPDLNKVTSFTMETGHGVTKPYFFSNSYYCALSFPLYLHEGETGVFKISKIEIFGAGSSAPVANSLAAVAEMDADTEFKVGCDLLVKVVNGPNIYVTDGTGWGCISTTTETGLQAGDYITGFTATYDSGNKTIIPTEGSTLTAAESHSTISAPSGLEVTLTDGTPFRNSEDMAVTTITYNRRYTNADSWKAWYAPFEISKDAFDDVVEFSAVDTQRNMLQFSTVTTSTLAANTPYLVKVKSTNETYTVTSGTLKKAESNVVNCDGYKLTGIYEWKDDMTVDYALAADGIFYHGSANALLQPFRFFLTIPAAQQNKPLRMAVDGEEVTGIADAIVDILVEGEWYDLQGRPVDPDTMRPGIYIHNGSKHLIP